MGYGPFIVKNDVGVYSATLIVYGVGILYNSGESRTRSRENTFLLIHIESRLRGVYTQRLGKGSHTASCG